MDNERTEDEQIEEGKKKQEDATEIGLMHDES